jgi:hypothetical protein
VLDGELVVRLRCALIVIELPGLGVEDFQGFQGSKLQTLRFKVQNFKLYGLGVEDFRGF